MNAWGLAVTNILNRPIPKQLPTEKPCNCCKKVKRLSEYSSHHNNADRKQNTCKACRSAQYRAKAGK